SAARGARCPGWRRCEPTRSTGRWPAGQHELSLGAGDRDQAAGGDGLRGPADALVGGADLGMVWALPAAGQGIRDQPQEQRDLDLHCQDSSDVSLHAAQTGPRSGPAAKAASPSKLLISRRPFRSPRAGASSLLTRRVRLQRGRRRDRVILLLQGARPLDKTAGNGVVDPELELDRLAFLLVRAGQRLALQLLSLPREPLLPPLPLSSRRRR